MRPRSVYRLVAWVVFFWTGCHWWHWWLFVGGKAGAIPGDLFLGLHFSDLLGETRGVSSPPICFGIHHFFCDLVLCLTDAGVHVALGFGLFGEGAKGHACDHVEDEENGDGPDDPALGPIGQDLEALEDAEVECDKRSGGEGGGGDAGDGGDEHGDGDDLLPGIIRVGIGEFGEPEVGDAFARGQEAEGVEESGDDAPGGDASILKGEGQSCKG